MLFVRIRNNADTIGVHADVVIAKRYARFIIVLPLHFSKFCSGLMRAQAGILNPSETEISYIHRRDLFVEFSNEPHFIKSTNFNHG